ncbi:hypothetical protein ACQ4PT_042766 [Festuca glaucescens]
MSASPTPSSAWSVTPFPVVELPTSGVTANMLLPATKLSCTESQVSTLVTDAVVKHVDWDGTSIRNKLQQHVEVHTESVRSAKLDELKATYEKKLLDALSGPVQSILETGERNSWASIRRLYRRETENAILRFLNSLSEYELDQTVSSQMVFELREHARCTVEKKAREEAGNVLMRMKERFSTVLSRDKDSMPRTWTANEDIRAITREARLAALRLMSVMAALRLDDKQDKIDRALMISLLDGGPLSQKRSIEFTSDPLASSTWQEVSPKDTLITPVQCKSIWRQFKAETEYPVAQAISMQVSGLLTISSSLLPTIMEIVTAIVNMSHNKKHSSHMSRQAGPHHAQSFSNQTRKHAQVHCHASPYSASSSSSVDSNSDNES